MIIHDEKQDFTLDNSEIELILEALSILMLDFPGEADIAHLYSKIEARYVRG